MTDTGVISRAELVEGPVESFQITQIAGMSYSTAVQRTCGVIVKPPSPTTATQGLSGSASLAPSTPLTPKPMAEKPQEFSMRCGRRADQNCMNQL